MYLNISGATTTALISPGDGISNVKEIHMANTHASDSVNIDLMVSTISSPGVAVKTFYIMKDYRVVDYLTFKSDILSFINSSVNGFGLFIKLNNSDSSVDVFIK